MSSPPVVAGRRLWRSSTSSTAAGAKVRRGCTRRPGAEGVEGLCPRRARATGGSGRGVRGALRPSPGS
eukprot:1340759-Alexandrium_andersonii.AAC.1